MPATKTTARKVRAGCKYCPACDKGHPVEDFAKNKAAADGLYRICKQAEAEWRKRRAAALAAGAPPVIRKGSPGYVAPGAQKAAPRKPSPKPKAAPKATPKPRSRKAPKA
jgi:hypothetical protein